MSLSLAGSWRRASRTAAKSLGLPHWIRQEMVSACWLVVIIFVRFVCPASDNRLRISSAESYVAAAQVSRLRRNAMTHFILLFYAFASHAQSLKTASGCP